MRLNIRENLRTASLDQTFYAFLKKKVHCRSGHFISALGADEVKMQTHFQALPFPSEERNGWFKRQVLYNQIRAESEELCDVDEEILEGLIKNSSAGINQPVSWWSGNAFVSGAGSLRFKPQAGHIGHSVADGSPPLRHFFERSWDARAQ